MMFREPWILGLVAVYAAVFFASRRRKRGGFYFPSDVIIRSFTGDLKVFLVKNMNYLRLVCASLVILAMARPQVSGDPVIKKEGIAVMIAVDCSSTMIADDIEMGLEDLAAGKSPAGGTKMKRIDAVKDIAAEFIKTRENDVIGIVAFAAEAFIASPPTFDHEWLVRSLERINVGIIRDGTAIGAGILSSLNSLRDVEAKSRVIILLTDGINNFGRISPGVAAKAARALGVKIYTVGIVSGGGGLEEAADGSGRRVYREPVIGIDEGELREIATLTDGEYFRAADMDSLRESWETIDKLERTGIEQKSYEEYTDVFQYFLYAALLLLILEIILRNTLMRSIP